MWAGPLAGLIAAVLDSAVYLGATVLGVVSEDVVVPGRGPITLGAVVSVSLMSGVLAAVVLALSFVPRFTLPGAPAGMVATLLLMHAVAAATIVFLLVTLATREGARKHSRPNPARGA